MCFQKDSLIDINSSPLQKKRRIWLHFIIQWMIGFSYGFCQSMVVPMVFPSMFINFLWVQNARSVNVPAAWASCKWHPRRRCARCNRMQPVAWMFWEYLADNIYRYIYIIYICMYVCMDVYIYVRMYVCMYVYIYCSRDTDMYGPFLDDFPMKPSIYPGKLWRPHVTSLEWWLARGIIPI